MDHDARIQAEIIDLESQDRPNITATAKRWQLARETLSKRFRGETGPNRDATSYARRQLTDAQEKALIGHIETLSPRCCLGPRYYSEATSAPGTYPAESLRTGEYNQHV